MSDLGKKRKMFVEKKDISHDIRPDTTESHRKYTVEELFKEIAKKVQEENQESGEQRQSEQAHKIYKKVREELSKRKNDFREETPRNTIEEPKVLGQNHVGEPQTETVNEEEENDLSIDKNNQDASEQELSLTSTYLKENQQEMDLKQRRREFFENKGFEDKEQDIKKNEPEQELSAIGKENGEKRKVIAAIISSITSIEQKENQEDDKESEPTSERNEESQNNNDIKDSEEDLENLNKEIEEKVKLEGEKSKDLEDLIDKAIEEFKIFKDPKLKELIKIYDGIVYKGNHFTKKFIRFIKDQDNDALNKKGKDNLVKRIDEFNENKNLNNLLKCCIKYTNFSQNKILEKLEDMNLKTSKYTLTKISHKVLTQKEYEERFPKPEDLVSDEQREGIIKDGRSKNPISIKNIAKTWGVGWVTARGIIKKDLGEKEYHKKFRISDEQREGIIKDGRSEDPDSIKNIAKTWGCQLLLL